MIAKVIIVDDERLLRRGFIHMTNWIDEGFEIAGEAANGLEALRLIEACEPQIVVTDIKMPHMNGIELTRKIKERYAEQIQVVVLSSFNDFEYVKEMLKLGAVDYVLKPQMQFPELLASLKKAREKCVAGLTCRKQTKEGACPQVEDRGTPSRKYSATLQKIMSYIDANYQNDISLETVANQFYLNKSYLSQLFKRHTGRTLQSHIANLRILKAKELLMEPEANVFEVGQRVGYNSPSYFGKVFKSIVKVSPSEFTRVMQDENE